MSLICPVCGKPERHGHKCNRRVLRRIDRAHASAGFLDEEPDEHEPTVGERLAEGFRMMRESRPDEREE